MEDRELLKLAAIAAGYALSEEWDSAADGLGIFIGRGDGDLECWNPLADDGAALRLAVGLQIQIVPGTYNKDEFTAFHAAHGEVHEYRNYLTDQWQATRRAIVRAAAEIGKRS